MRAGARGARICMAAAVAMLFVFPSLAQSQSANQACSRAGRSQLSTVATEGIIICDSQSLTWKTMGSSGPSGIANNLTLGVRTNNQTFNGNVSGITGTSFTAEVRANGAKPALTWHYEDTSTRHLALSSDGFFEVLVPSGDLTTNNGIRLGSTLLSSTSITAPRYTLPGNPVGTIYGAGQSVAPSYYIGQVMGGDDGWRIYGESAASNSGNLVFETIDDDDSNETFVFRTKMTYSPYSATNLLVMNHSAITYKGGAIWHAGNAPIQHYGNGTMRNGLPWIDNTGTIKLQNPENFTGEVRLGAAWDRGGVYATSTLSLSSDSAIEFVLNNTVYGSVRPGGFYTGGWYRNYGQIGMHNEDYQLHWYAESNAGWTHATNGNAIGEILFRHGYQGALKGAVYWDGNGFGLLNDAHTWAVRVFPGTGGQMLYGRTSISSGGMITFEQSGIAPDGIPYARLIENYGLRFGSPDTRWVLSTAGSLLVGHVPDGRDYGAGNVHASGRGYFTVGIAGYDNINIQYGSPTLHFTDTDELSGMIHVNSNRMYLLRGCGVAATTWCQVNGRWPVEIDLTNNNVAFGGNLYGVGYFIHSDERLKHNIATLEGSLDKIRKLRPVSYDLKETGTHKIGFIAQEVQTVEPVLVSEGADPEKMLSVDYASTTPLLVGAVQEIDRRLAGMANMLLSAALLSAVCGGTAGGIVFLLMSRRRQ